MTMVVTPASKKPLHSTSNRGKLVHMNTIFSGQAVATTSSHPNNARLRQLVMAAKLAGLTQVEALERFNEGQVRPITLSAFKAWLADPEAVRFRPLADKFLAHAEKVLPKSAKK